MGVYQLDNGNWAYRYVVVIDGRKQARKRTKNDDGKPFTTEKQAIRARRLALAKEQLNIDLVKKVERKTVEQVFNEYCEKGRTGKAYATIKKQDSLWNNHIKSRFGKVDILDLNTAEIQDYLAELYYVEGRAYSYVESFFKNVLSDFRSGTFKGIY